MTAESYISHFSHSSLPLLVELLPICVDDVQYIFEIGECRRRRRGFKCSNSCSLDAKQR